MILIQYIPQNEQPGRANARSFDGFRLEPGRNTIDDSDYLKIVSHPDYQTFLRWGAIKVISEKVDKEESKSLLALNIEESIDLVSQETDVETLKEWRSVESKTKSKNRTTVLNAISQQIKAVEEGRL